MSCSHITTSEITTGDVRTFNAIYVKSKGFVYLWTYGADAIYPEYVIRHTSSSKSNNLVDARASSASACGRPCVHLYYFEADNIVHKMLSLYALNYIK